MWVGEEQYPSPSGARALWKASAHLVKAPQDRDEVC